MSDNIEYDGFAPPVNLMRVCDLKEVPGQHNGLDRVADFMLSDDKKKLRIREGCDQYYWADLNCNQVAALVDFLHKTWHTMLPPPWEEDEI